MREFPTQSSYFSPQIFLPSWMPGWRRNLYSGKKLQWNVKGTKNKVNKLNSNTLDALSFEVKDNFLFQSAYLIKR